MTDDDLAARLRAAAPTSSRTPAAMPGRADRRRRRRRASAVVLPVGALLATLALVLGPLDRPAEQRVVLQQPESATAVIGVPAPTPEPATSIEAGIVPSPVAPPLDPPPSPIPTPLVAQVDPLPDGPLASRIGAAAVWTGREVVIWGGETGPPGNPSPPERFSDGAAYDPATRSWRPLPPSPLPPRSFAQAVWDGEAVVVAGGAGAGSASLSAAAWNPVSGVWRPLPDLPLQPSALVRTDAGVLALAGDEAGAVHASLLRQGDTEWNVLPTAPLPPVHAPYAVRAGAEVVVLAAPRACCDGGVRIVGAALRPGGGGSWRTIAPPTSSAGWLTRPLWSGREVLLLNHATEQIDGGGTNPFPTVWPSAAYDPVTDVWRDPALPVQPQGGGPSVWAAGRAVFVSTFEDTVTTYDPATDSWTTFPADHLGLRESPTVVTTNDGVLAWGGYEGFEPRDDGVLIRFVAG